MARAPEDKRRLVRDLTRLLADAASLFTLSLPSLLSLSLSQVRDRFRAALLEATPYCLRLRGDGCHTVLDLVKYNVPELNLPPALQVTMES